MPAKTTQPQNLAEQNKDLKHLVAGMSETIEADAQNTEQFVYLLIQVRNNLKANQKTNSAPSPETIALVSIAINFFDRQADECIGYARDRLQDLKNMEAANHAQ